MKVRIDENECTGCEECVEAAPSVFEMNDDGDLAKVKITEIPEDMEDEIQEVAEDCPAEAIIIE